MARHQGYHPDHVCEVHRMFNSTHECWKTVLQVQAEGELRGFQTGEFGDTVKANGPIDILDNKPA